MNAFPYLQGQLQAESVSLDAIARHYGTPCYVYSRAALEHNLRAYQAALHGQPHLICYAVKANSNLAVLDTLARLGAGFDIVSGGELERVVAAGGDPAKTVFSGVGKTPDEMGRALELGIHCFNLESAAELEVLNRVAAAQDRVAPVSVRVNPDVDAKTHPYIATGLRENKFGIEFGAARGVYRRAAELSHLAGRSRAGSLAEPPPLPEEARDWEMILEAIDHVLLGDPDGVKPIWIIDDAAVPVDRLVEYTQDVVAAGRQFGLDIDFDAHASAGCLHMGVEIDLRTPEGLRHLELLSRKIMDIAIAHNGNKYHSNFGKSAEFHSHF